MAGWVFVNKNPDNLANGMALLFESSKWRNSEQSPP
jgi:hypothetical protein